MVCTMRPFEPVSNGRHPCQQPSLKYVTVIPSTASWLIATKRGARPQPLTLPTYTKNSTKGQANTRGSDTWEKQGCR